MLTNTLIGFNVEPVGTYLYSTVAAANTKLLWLMAVNTAGSSASAHCRSWYQLSPADFSSPILNVTFILDGVDIESFLTVLQTHSEF